MKLNCVLHWVWPTQSLIKSSHKQINSYLVLSKLSLSSRRKVTIAILYIWPAIHSGPSTWRKTQPVRFMFWKWGHIKVVSSKNCYKYSQMFWIFSFIICYTLLSVFTTPTTPFCQHKVLYTKKTTTKCGINYTGISINMMYFKQCCTFISIPVI